MNIYSAYRRFDRTELIRITVRTVMKNGDKKKYRNSIKKTEKGKKREKRVTNFRCIYLKEFLFILGRVHSSSPSWCPESSPCNRRPWCTPRERHRRRTGRSDRSWPRRTAPGVSGRRCKCRALGEARRCRPCRNPPLSDRRRISACTKSARYPRRSSRTARCSPTVASSAVARSCASPIPSRPSRSPSPAESKTRERERAQKRIGSRRRHARRILEKNRDRISAWRHLPFLWFYHSERIFSIILISKRLFNITNFSSVVVWINRIDSNISRRNKFMSFLNKLMFFFFLLFLTFYQISSINLREIYK